MRTRMNREAVPIPLRNPSEFSTMTCAIRSSIFNPRTSLASEWLMSQKLLSFLFPKRKLRLRAVRYLSKVCWEFRNSTSLGGAHFRFVLRRVPSTYCKQSLSYHPCIAKLKRSEFRIQSNGIKGLQQIQSLRCCFTKSSTRIWT